jgi:hypothetical protein
VRVFVALDIQHGMHMRHIVISALPGSTVGYIYTVSRKGQINKKINEQKFFLIVYTDFV